MNRKLFNALLASAAVLVAGCREPSPVAPAGLESFSVERQVLAEGPQEVRGEAGGALYALFIPADWNGDVVVYAHGIVAATAPIALPETPMVTRLRDGLLARGFGVAYSSWSENGFAIKSGVIRTRQLRELFASNFGQPRRIYLAAHSGGAPVVLRLAEENPQRYDGVLSMCGIVGGSRMELDYIFNVRVLFDYFYPGIIPGDAVHVPDGLDFGRDVAPAVVAAILANPGPAMELAQVDQVDVRYANGPELIQSILTPLFFNTVGFFMMDDVRERAHGHDFFDNMRTAYSGSADDAALNAGVDRFAAAPDAQAYFEHWYEPEGTLRMPVLTLHTTRDPTAPFFHEAAYQAAVAAAGASDFLIQRPVTGFGHCAWDVSQELAAFEDLVTWVENGTRPTP